MGIELLEKRFEQMGARIKLSEIAPGWRNQAGIDIRSDDKGEFFEIKIDRDEPVNYEVVNLRSDLRHLLLMARRNDGSKEKFLCGHDERHWFVCAVPGNGISNVTAAMEALQPNIVRWEVRDKVKRAKNRLARRNEAFVRQGEWFFVPVERLRAKKNLIFRNEPISRGRGSKPHICEEIYRVGGAELMVCERYPNGVGLNVYSYLMKTDHKARKWNWTMMRANASVYARGKVRHPDHKTIELNGWHRVLMNTEGEAPGARAVVFLD